MKRHCLSLCLVLCLARCAAASDFINNLIMTNRSNIDATVFVNDRTIFFDLLALDTVQSVDSVLFQTRDTLYYTNNVNGLLMAQPGFNFETVTATGAHAADSFNNAGLVIAVDAPVVSFYLSEGTIPVLLPASPALSPGYNVPVAGAILVSAADIINSGTMLVGDIGLLQLNGTTLQLSGALGAGTVSELDTNMTLGRGIVENGSATAFYPFFAPPKGVYDLAWGVTNGASSSNNLPEIAIDLYEMLYGYDYPIYLPYPTLGSRNGTLYGDILSALPAPGIVPEDITPIGTLVEEESGDLTNIVTASYESYIYTNVFYATLADENAGRLTYYYNIVLVNTNFQDTNISVNVGFLGEDVENTNLLLVEYFESPDVLTNGDLNGIEDIVQFSAQVPDVLTGDMVANSLYVVDTGQIQVPAVEAVNSVYPIDEKPLSIEITRSQPEEWPSVAPTNLVLAPIDLYYLIYGLNPTTGLNEFNKTTVPMTNVFYAAQAGRDPEVRDGLFPYTEALLGTAQTGFPDVTNEGGRISMTAKTIEMTNLSIRANGFVEMNCPNLRGTPAAADFGNMELVLGNLSSSLLVSNLLPAQFHRLRGDITAYSATWMNTQTNSGLGTNGIGTNNISTNAAGTGHVTNYYYFHVLVVDQSLRSSFRPTALDASLSGSNVELDDPLCVMGNAVLKATNLTVNSILYLTGATGELQPANVPQMQHLLIGPNGSVAADAEINLGVTARLNPAVPTAQNTPILSITNDGVIISGQTEIQARTFANAGTVAATNDGAIVLNAITNFLGAGALGLANTLSAGADINLTANSIQATNSQILAGQTISGQLVLYVPGELTDHYPSTPSTGVYVSNLWQVTGGFSLPVKPASGDLFATQITTYASNDSVTVDHVWAGQDRGPTLAGFENNEVIGHLILDRTATNGILRFSAAGKSNAMYVDYLEMRDLALSDYHVGVVVDSNFKIYFANANVDPLKLRNVYSNIIWVPQFAGPNSTAYVQVTAPGREYTIPINAALSTSPDLSSSDNGLANVNDPFPLNNPAAGPYPIPSPSLVTSTLGITNGVTGQVFVIWTTGAGRIKTNVSLAGLQFGQTLSNISLTAVPSNNWLFTNWSWPVLARPALVTNPSITFPVPTNAFYFVTANFITNPFIALAGVYNGLFTSTGANGIAGNNSGFVTFTLNSQGVFSGKLRMGTTNYPFSAQFDIAQYATLLATNGKNVLSAAIQLSQSGLTDMATGSVNNAEFSASLTAYRVPGWTAANPAPQAGSYTLVLPGDANAAAGPGGDSYGTVNVDALGNLTAIGTLADNVSFSQSVPLSMNGQWPLYIAPSGVPQPLMGWVTFDDNGIGGSPAGFSGTVTWVKAAGPGTLYTNGFTNTSFLLGSAYSAAFQKTNGLALANPTVTLSGGDLGDITYPVIASGLETYKTADGTTLTLTISPSGGGFSGQYEPSKGKKISLAGVVLQNRDDARGFFLGTNQSGAVRLQGN
jgi:hypothetical protein